MKPETGKSNDKSGIYAPARKFADSMRGLFYLVSALSLVIVMIMFIFVWQPIWVSGFKDFHTISESIDNLNRTTKPASETAPLILEEMVTMRNTINDMGKTMKTMQGSVQTLESMPPNMAKMTSSVDHMDYTVASKLEEIDMSMREMNVSIKRMVYLLDQLEENTSPSGMMPFNW